MNEELANIYKEAQKAVADDLRQNFYTAVQNRTQAFRQLNNTANARHALYSGAPAASQMQYDQGTLFPTTNTAAVKALAKQQENQESWDSYMEYIQNLNEQAAYYNNLANSIGSTPSNSSSSSNNTYSNNSKASSTADQGIANAFAGN